MPRVVKEEPTREPAVVLAFPEQSEQLTLFDLGVDLVSLRRERASLAERRRAQATREAYACDWSDFCAWCGAAGRSSLPASSDTLSLYLVDLARRGRLVSTIQRRVSAISHYHLAAGLASPAGADVREVLCGLRRKLGTAPQRAKAAVSVDELRKLLGAVSEGVRGVRDRALLLLGFASSLRSAELVGLDLRDVAVERAGVVLTLRRSKTDQEGAGRQVGVHPGARKSTCPVRAVKAWLKERGRWPGPLFCQVGADGAIEREALDSERVRKVVQRAARRAGLDGRRFGAHSLRAGFATAAAINGAPELAIMERTGHRTVTMVRRYVRKGSVLAGANPLDGVL